MIVRQEHDIQQIRSEQVPRVEIDNLRASTTRERDDIKDRLDRLEGAVFVPRTLE